MSSDFTDIPHSSRSEEMTQNLTTSVNSTLLSAQAEPYIPSSSVRIKPSPPSKMSSSRKSRTKTKLKNAVNLPPFSFPVLPTLSQTPNPIPSFGLAHPPVLPLSSGFASPGSHSTTRSFRSETPSTQLPFPSLPLPTSTSFTPFSHSFGFGLPSLFATPSANLSSIGTTPSIPLSTTPTKPQNIPLMPFLTPLPHRTSQIKILTDRVDPMLTPPALSTVSASQKAESSINTPSLNACMTSSLNASSKGLFPHLPDNTTAMESQHDTSPSRFLAYQTPQPKTYPKKKNERTNSKKKSVSPHSIHPTPNRAANIFTHSPEKQQNLFPSNTAPFSTLHNETTQTEPPLIQISPMAPRHFKSPSPPAVILLLGVCGSGKTTQGRLLARNHPFLFFSGGETLRQLSTQTTHNWSLRVLASEALAAQLALLGKPESAYGSSKMEAKHASRNTSRYRGIVIDRQGKSVEDFCYLLHTLRSNGLRLNAVAVLALQGEIAKKRMMQREEEEKGERKNKEEKKGGVEAARPESGDAYAIGERIKATEALTRRCVRFISQVDRSRELVCVVDTTDSVELSHQTLCFSVAHLFTPSIQQRVAEIDFFPQSTVGPIELVESSKEYAEVLDRLLHLLACEKAAKFPGTVTSHYATKKFLEERQISSHRTDYRIFHRYEGLRCLCLISPNTPGGYLIPRHMKCIYRIRSGVWNEDPFVKQKLTTLDGDFILDGELVPICASGFPGHPLQWTRPDSGISSFLYSVSDLLMSNGQLATRRSWEERHSLLNQILHVENEFLTSLLHTSRVSFLFLSKGAFRISQVEEALENTHRIPELKVESYFFQHNGEYRMGWDENIAIWKPLHLLSFDFRVGDVQSLEDNATARLSLECLVHESGTRARYVPIPPSDVVEAPLHETTRFDLEFGSIVECTLFARVDGSYIRQLHFLRVNYEKTASGTKSQLDELSHLRLHLATKADLAHFLTFRNAVSTSPAHSPAASQIHRSQWGTRGLVDAHLSPSFQSPSTRSPILFASNRPRSGLVNSSLREMTTSQTSENKIKAESQTLQNEYAQISTKRESGEEIQPLVAPIFEMDTRSSSMSSHSSTRDISPEFGVLPPSYARALDPSSVSHLSSTSNQIVSTNSEKTSTVFGTKKSSCETNATKNFSPETSKHTNSNTKPMQTKREPQPETDASQVASETNRLAISSASDKPKTGPRKCMECDKPAPGRTDDRSATSGMFYCFSCWRKYGQDHCHGCRKFREVHPWKGYSVCRGCSHLYGCCSACGKPRKGREDADAKFYCDHCWSEYRYEWSNYKSKHRNSKK